MWSYRSRSYSSGSFTCLNSNYSYGEFEPPIPPPIPPLDGVGVGAGGNYGNVQFVPIVSSVTVSLPAFELGIFSTLSADSLSATLNKSEVKVANEVDRTEIDLTVPSGFSSDISCCSSVFCESIPVKVVDSKFSYNSSTSFDINAVDMIDVIKVESKVAFLLLGYSKIKCDVVQNFQNTAIRSTLLIKSSFNSKGIYGKDFLRLYEGLLNKQKQTVLNKSFAVGDLEFTVLDEEDLDIE